MSQARVVVTGLGAVSPLGLGVPETWAGLCAGRCGIRRIRAFDPTGLPCEWAGEVPEYRIQERVPRTYRKAVKLMCRDIELAVLAAGEAITSGGLVTKGIDPEKVNIDPTRFGINIGAGIICCDLVELGPAVAASTLDGRFDLHKWGREGLQLVTPLWLLKYLPNMPACHIGIIHDMQGPSNTITCSEAAAHLALGEAAQVIARGDADLALAGGAEAKVNQMMILRQHLLRRAVSTGTGDPETICRPFDANACGAIFGEGAAMLVLENLDHARRRNARILAEIAGIGQSHSMSAAYERLEPDGQGIRIAVEKALADAEIGPEDLDLVIPHGTAIPQDDLAEARGLAAALGPAVKKIPVWPTKSMLSTTGAAGGALDVVAAVQAITEGVIPPARNFQTPAPGCPLNVLTARRDGPIRHVLCCSYTHGGQTAAIVLRKFEIRNPKSETNPNDPNSNDQNAAGGRGPVSNLRI
ncbi:MAG: beta-ketoacyl-[acyl-carrier-protein] synthase family protein [Planctomycetes bacterium]|nr:beta-ketoacyl-[acyl-carrier-protein] synthase family protein [Planctomycetota bacterium]